MYHPMSLSKYISLLAFSRVIYVNFFFFSFDETNFFSCGNIICNSRLLSLSLSMAGNFLFGDYCMYVTCVLFFLCFFYYL